MKKILFLAMVLCSMTALAQQDFVIGTDESDILYRPLVAAAPEMAYEKVVVPIDPALEVVSISALASDNDGNLYIIQRGKEADPIIVIDPNGKVLRSFGADLFTRPHSIKLDREGNVWTADSTSSMVYKFSSAGEKLLEISVGNLFDPGRASCASSDVAITDNGHVYVTDGYCNARIVEYDATGTKVREWGQAGIGPGEFDLPHGIAVSPEGNIYVADRENGRVQWFTPEGNYLGEWLYGGRIVSIAFSATGEIFIGGEPKIVSEPMVEASIIQIDPQTGEMLGQINAFGHELSIGLNGDLLTGSLSEQVILYRKKP